MTTPQATLSERDETTGLVFIRRAARTPAPAGLVVLLHGVGGNETNLLPVAQSLSAAFEVLLVRGPLTLGPAQHAWFRVNFGANGPRIDEAQAEAARSTLIRFLASQQARLGVSPEHTVLAGFSQGGIMSAGVGLTAPHSLTGFGLLSGRILPEIAPLIAPREVLTRLRGFISHGNEDGVLPVSWADRAKALLGEHGVAFETHRYAANHEITPAMLADFVAWSTRTLTEVAIPLSLSDASLRLGHDGESLHLPLGTTAVITDFLRHVPPHPVELENAIQQIEDDLQPAVRRFAGHTLVTHDAWFAELASLTSSNASISREALEILFGKLAARAEGRPTSQDRLPEDAHFAARLLVLRELMHHLDFSVLRRA
ncbi:MAG: hypothetical protein CGU28_15475 [Candidatus Dactylopiibacterium carminicum]|uniref:Phospholipase/carboxylesterase/thioesterase domain-containing protein n=1 Tax=Candidatus Dactylopiibacterium carminicum TaxID=857335 RepID=A0A272EN63_9RHOO|nr:hypothetical protein [Candidatus Dactylopiibacterium carminicum]KAF7597976.1 hypothetical protein BGI27_15815 [Candidatus Dactylopiibacterium carminicum]PAS91555.1 MAG: hypothetical protein CGU29_15815 [Candidatus Dactylopiibacterium carminicum]PAS93212.1 MAG: hypothetical protein CGU28_15475 [Candidatus Dactylopiibacterium carminicum]